MKILRSLSFLVFALVAISLSFGQIEFTSYNLGKFKLNSGTYKVDDSEILGPEQRIEINTSNGQFRLTHGKVVRLEDNSEVPQITDPKQVDNVFRRVYFIAAQDYTASKDKFNAERPTTFEKEYESLERMFEQRNGVKIYVLGDKNLLIEGAEKRRVPGNDEAFDFLLRLLDPLVHAYHEVNQAKYKVTQASTEEEKSAASQEMDKASKKYQSLLEEAKFSSSSDNYDLGDVKKYVEFPETFTEWRANQWRMESELKNCKGQKFLLISLSKPIDELLRNADISDNVPLSSHEHMLFGNFFWKK